VIQSNHQPFSVRGFKSSTIISSAGPWEVGAVHGSFSEWGQIVLLAGCRGCVSG